MNQFKRAQVVMIPTENETNIFLSEDKLNISSTFKKVINIGFGQHLYIISDDEIKENDWCYDQRPNEEGELTDIIYQVKDIKTEMRSSSEKKIIATTDTSLKIFGGKGDICDLFYPLPQPSQQFIEKYIESYNKGEVITDVLVEYEKCNIIEPTYGKLGRIHNGGSWDYQLKVNPKDNTITIKKLKDSWNREEYEQQLRELGKDLMTRYQNGNGVFQYNIDNWIEKNL